MHADALAGLSRRDMLMRGLALIGAAVGVHAVSKVDPASLADAVTVLGRDFHLRPTRGNGPLTQRGDAGVASGDLVDAAGGVIGTFHGTRVAIAAPGAVGLEAPVALDWHTLRLPDGAIFGTGTASHSVDHGDHYAIVGGTGRYAGAAGSYVAYLRHRELGGDGTAEFTINVLNRRF